MTYGLLAYNHNARTVMRLMLSQSHCSNSKIEISIAYPALYSIENELKVLIQWFLKIRKNGFGVFGGNLFKRGYAYLNRPRKYPITHRRIGIWGDLVMSAVASTEPTYHGLVNFQLHTYVVRRDVLKAKDSSDGCMDISFPARSTSPAPVDCKDIRFHSK